MYSDDDYYEGDEYSAGYGYGHTGDPNMDRMEFALPEPVKKFLVHFQEMIKVAQSRSISNLEN